MIIGITGASQKEREKLAKLMQAVSLNMSYSSWLLHEKLDQNRYWQIKRFGEKIEQMVSILTGIPIKDMESPEAKESKLSPKWERSKCEGCNEERQFKQPDRNALGYFECPKCRQISMPGFTSKGISIQEVLTSFTKAIQETVHPNGLVYSLIEDYKRCHPHPYYPYLEGSFPNWIITDVCHENQAQAIKQEKGIIVRLKVNTDAHRNTSDEGLDDLADFTLITNGTESDIDQKLRSTAKVVAILQRK